MTDDELTELRPSPEAINASLEHDAATATENGRHAATRAVRRLWLPLAVGVAGALAFVAWVIFIALQTNDNTTGRTENAAEVTRLRADVDDLRAQLCARPTAEQIATVLENATSYQDAAAEIRALAADCAGG